MERSHKTHYDLGNQHPRLGPWYFPKSVIHYIVSNIADTCTYSSLVECHLWCWSNYLFLECAMSQIWKLSLMLVLHTYLVLLWLSLLPPAVHSLLSHMKYSSSFAIWQAILGEVSVFCIDEKAPNDISHYVCSRLLSCAWSTARENIFTVIVHIGMRQASLIPPMSSHQCFCIHRASPS